MAVEDLCNNIGLTQTSTHPVPSRPSPPVPAAPQLMSPEVTALRAQVMQALAPGPVAESSGRGTSRSWISENAKNKGFRDRKPSDGKTKENETSMLY